MATTHTVQPRTLTDNQGDTYDMWAVIRPDGSPARMTRPPTSAEWRPAPDGRGAMAVFIDQEDAEAFARLADQPA